MFFIPDECANPEGIIALLEPQQQITSSLLHHYDHHHHHSMIFSYPSTNSESEPI